VGVGGLASHVTADENNFYIWMSGGQVLISTDGITWTIRTLPASFTNVSAVKTISFGAGKIASVSSGVLVWSNDGGVTWSASGITSASYGHHTAVQVVSSGATTYLVTSNTFYSSGDGCAVISAADLSQGGALFRATTSALNPIRSGATAKIRVA
jgi:hypothetical protein